MPYYPCRECGKELQWQSRDEYEVHHELCYGCAKKHGLLQQHTIRFANPHYGGFGKGFILGQLRPDAGDPDIIWIAGRYYFARKKGLLKRKYPLLIQRTVPHEVLHRALDKIGESEASDLLDNYEVFGYMGEIDPSTGLQTFDEIERAFRRKRAR